MTCLQGPAVSAVKYDVALLHSQAQEQLLVYHQLSLVALSASEELDAHASLALHRARSCVDRQQAH
jgi:hypothetical protein